MPIYEYVCKACGAQSEAIHKATDAPLTTCEKCGGEVYRAISRTSFQLKGGGWYKDGYGSPSGAKPSTGDQTPSSETTTKTDTSAASPAASSTPAAAPKETKS